MIMAKVVKAIKNIVKKPSKLVTEKQLPPSMENIDKLIIIEKGKVIKEVINK